MGNDRVDFFNFYLGGNKNPDQIKFSQNERSNIFSELVSNLKRYKGEKQSFTVAKNTWIKCIKTSVDSEYFLYDIGANEDSFNEDSPVPPDLLASWFYPHNDKRLNNLSDNKTLLRGKDFINEDEKKDYFSETIQLGKKYYYVLKELGNLRKKIFIVNLLWWIGNDVLKLE